jgi:hypothetical protein
MTWWDHDTGSIWSQPLGEAIAGPRKGQTVELLPMTYTTWDAWREAYPRTLALDAPGRRSGFDLGGFYLVVDFTSDVTAYPVQTLRLVGVVNDEVAGLEIAVLIDPTDDRRWSVFSRRLDDRVVTLGFDGDRLVDTETGSTWDPVLGVARDGPLQGRFLDKLPALTSFPGDYDTFWPDGDVWSP